MAQGKLNIHRPPGGSGYVLREKLFVGLCLVAVFLPLVMLMMLFGKLLLGNHESVLQTTAALLNLTPNEVQVLTWQMRGPEMIMMGTGRGWG